jgi:hypothetical protein
MATNTPTTFGVGNLQMVLHSVSVMLAVLLLLTTVFTVFVSKTACNGATD